MGVIVLYADLGMRGFISFLYFVLLFFKQCLLVLVFEFELTNESECDNFSEIGPLGQVPVALL